MFYLYKECPGLYEKNKVAPIETRKKLGGFSYSLHFVGAKTKAKAPFF